ncbi:MAG: fructosamine kinase family protein [Alphaproteobacteria bacterium]|nr:fructosamine kinase family protein [Alphaproteobacteria bacterium]
MDAEFAARIEAATGSRPVRRSPLSGGCIAEVYRVELANGGRVVAKVAAGQGDLELEAWMLRYLAAHSELPVPAVLSADADVLIIDYVETAGGISASAQAHAAELLAALHAIEAEQFGLERDTLIGPLHQPNPRRDKWLDFFAQHRLIHMGREALDARRIPPSLMARIETFAGRLHEWLEEPAAPALIHGDMWGGNVLTLDGRIAAFVDPAIYYADPEIELAFSTLFSTFGAPFFARYGELRPLAPGFFEARRDIYNLYPLLVHARLFGGAYAAQVDGILKRLGG